MPSQLPSTEYLQKIIDDTVILLLELRSKPDLTRFQRAQTEEAVNKLQEISRRLPDLANKRTGRSLVFDAIRRTISVWRQLFE